MVASTPLDTESIVLTNIDRNTFEQVASALAECHPRFTYDHGNLELRSTIHGLSWDNYQRFIIAIGDRHLRHAYGGGTLEMMSPRKDHDWIKRLIGRFIEAMTLDLDIVVQSMGSTTIMSNDFECGVQPDEAYYVQSEPRVRGKLNYQPGIDPPPDLVVEVDVTSSSVVRLPAYWAVGVPEIWRHDGRQIRFLKRTDHSAYVEIGQSLAFPFLSPADVNESLTAVTNVNENQLVKQFVKRAHQCWDSYQSSSRSP